MAGDILVIDDDPDILEAMHWFLEDEGIGISVAATMAQVQASLAADPLPGVVLLDLYLADCDGTEICAVIRGSERTRHLPVILMSAHPSGPNVAERCGATAFIAKPFDLDEMLAMIQRCRSAALEDATPAEPARTVSAAAP